MIKTFCFRIYPSRSQRKRLDDVLETCRRFYNACLEERRTAWEEEKRAVGKFEQLRHVKDEKASNPWAKEIHSHVLQVVVADLDKAFRAFFRRVKAGETPGYPRFKARDRFSSFGFKEHRNGFRVDGRCLKVSGIGRIKVRWHRRLEGSIKSLRLVRKADGWYTCFACEVESEPLEPTGQDVGVDVGIASLLTTDTGEKVQNPKHYRRVQKKLRVQQRRVARRKKGGSNRRKAVRVLARQHQHIANQRADFLNKVVHNLIVRFDRIAVEDLKITNMVHNRHLSKSILDAGWGYFANRLSSKAVEAGRVVCFVEPSYTSKTCSACGTIFDSLKLSDRWVNCGCGLSMDRDENAARNILERAGRAHWGISSAVVGLLQEAAPL